MGAITWKIRSGQRVGKGDVRKRCGVVCEVLWIAGVCTLAAGLIFAIPVVLAAIVELNAYTVGFAAIPVVLLIMVGSVLLGSSKLLKRISRLVLGEES